MEVKTIIAVIAIVTMATIGLSLTMTSNAFAVSSHNANGGSADGGSWRKCQWGKQRSSC